MVIAEGDDPDRFAEKVHNEPLFACREAETHFCEAGQWKAAVKMFRKANQWEDVVRVAKAHGGAPACKQVCLLVIDCCQPPSAVP